MHYQLKHTIKKLRINLIVAAFIEPTTHVTEIVNVCSLSTLQTRQFKHAQQFQFDGNKDQCLLYLSDLFVGVDVWK